MQISFHTVNVTPDGRYLFVYTSALTGGAAITVTDLSADDPSPWAIVKSYDDSWVLLGNVVTVLYLATQMDAPRGRVTTPDLSEAEPEFVELIPEWDDAVLREGSAAVLGDRIVLSYMVDAQTRVERLHLEGTPDGQVDLPGPGTTGAFHGRPGDDEAFFAFTSYDAPLTIHRLEVGANRTTVWAEPDPERMVLERQTVQAAAFLPAKLPNEPATAPVSCATPAVVRSSTPVRIVLSRLASIRA